MLFSDIQYNCTHLIFAFRSAVVVILNQLRSQEQIESYEDAWTRDDNRSVRGRTRPALGGSQSQTIYQ